MIADMLQGTRFVINYEFYVSLDDLFCLYLMKNLNVLIVKLMNSCSGFHQLFVKINKLKNSK